MHIAIITTFANGLGNDAFWPPTHPRGTESYYDILRETDDGKHMYDYCEDPTGKFGYPKEHDVWSTGLDVYYGDKASMQGHSNIVFSNGLLDHWSSAGVYGKEGPVPGVHNVTPDTAKSRPTAFVLNLGNAIVVVSICPAANATSFWYTSRMACPDCT